jgi:hypothetical protein
MELVRSTPVTRSWKSTLTSLLFALAMLGAGTFLFYENRVITPVIFLFLAIVGMWAAVSNSYTGDCPACGAVQKRLGGLHRCDHCLAYGEVVKGAYRELESDRVLKTPMFAARVPEPCHMPKLCSRCGLPAARFEKLRIIRKEFAFDLDVPHCELHTGGADLATERVQGKGGTEIPVLKVASYRFYREFLKQNKSATG